MAKSADSYDKKAKKKSILKSLGQGLDTKHNAKNTLLESGKDLIIGVIGGGLAGAAIGKPSLLIGLGVAGVGHYLDCQPAKLLGIGLMASNGFQDKNLKGLDGLDGVKERIVAYKESFAEKLYLPAALHKKHPGKAVNGVGEVQHFSYPQDLGAMRKLYQGMDDEDMAMEHIHKQIQSSGDSHAQRYNMTDTEIASENGEEDTQEQDRIDRDREEKNRDKEDRDRQIEREKEIYREDNTQTAHLTYSHTENII